MFSFDLKIKSVKSFDEILKTNDLFPSDNNSNNNFNTELEFTDTILNVKKKFENYFHPFQFQKFGHDLNKHFLLEILEEKLVEIELLKKENSKLNQLKTLIPINKSITTTTTKPDLQEIDKQLINENQSFENYLNQEKNNLKVDDDDDDVVVVVDNNPNFIIIKNQPFFENLLQSLKMKLSFQNIVEKQINDLAGIKENDIIFFASTSTGIFTNIEKDTLQINEIRSKIGDTIPILYCIFNMGKDAKPTIKILNTIPFSLTHSISEIDHTRLNNITLTKIKNCLPKSI
ncbi:hypothetical protein DDB_G0289681 [Dictyostelium discoideum AX4]|uniref:Uncharacterized protein n=1 Tax=Dictyostelium discoideum TaxID=44689 RepID=Q54H65_DICDI|nr:hypothetical protein DDB_G0289681 [Dictyostelium discoideum AX4]EAL62552.1 hypothetical protein DDB_G0289681 [Dictyostelium discoideum AX4]|eukprot:XP_636053.1 hypothetical protein DDB_G0289681 [Dictyostelium discoideum AX4]